MKHIVIISFDLLREKEGSISLSIASLLSYLKNDRRYNQDYTINHLPINMWECDNPKDQLYSSVSKLPLDEIDTIGISCYVWSEYITNPLIKKLRTQGFSGKIVLGGYQISYSSQKKVENEYPQADIFIYGNAEKSFLKAILLEKPIIPIHLNEFVDFSEIPSVYTTSELPVLQNQKMVRWETKRGCPYKCRFCAHRDLTKNKVYKHGVNKLFAELSFFKEKNVKRINILDPVFNAGNSYLDILKEITRIGLESTITMQTRFELIREEKGDIFLDLCKSISSHLEFGLQTAIETESHIIDRKNNIKYVSHVLNKLNTSAISYEVSLIYGLPEQTVSTFKESINFLRQNGCTNIVAYPLMLLKGTELYDQKDEYGLIEEEIGKFHIPTVVSSNSFTKDGWLEMESIAQELNNNHRYA